ncbi:MAG: hypothetical protein ACK5BL_02645 [Flavobacteriales bacterium]
MKFIYTAVLLVFSALWSTMSAQIVEGQSCSAPISLECGLVYSSSTTGVPNDNASSGANLCGGVGAAGQIWYSYTATESGLLTVSTCGSAFDTRIHVFTGSCGQLDCYAQNDDACSMQSLVTFEVIQGETYLVRMGGFGSLAGAFFMTVSCGENVAGCTDPYASNFNPAAITDDGSCQYSGCTDPTAANYNPYATTDDGSCIQWVSGCTNPAATNYNPDANTDDGSCIIEGCTDATAQNYNPAATVDNGSCEFCNGAGSTQLRACISVHSQMVTKLNCKSLTIRVTRYIMLQV